MEGDVLHSFIHHSQKYVINLNIVCQPQTCTNYAININVLCRDITLYAINLQIPITERDM